MFAIHGHLLPHCSTYEQAVEVYNKAHQHARFTSGWRGLKDKRDTSKQVCMTGTGAVVFRYHHTDMITWEPNHVEIRPYDSRSSGVFLDRFLPTGLTTRSIGGELYIRDCGTDDCFTASNNVLVFTYDGKWNVDPTTVFRGTAHVLDRKRANEVRKIMAPFLDWWESMDRLGAPINAQRYAFDDVLLSLKTSINKGVIPEEHYRQLAASMAYIGPRTDLLPQAYVLGGAVIKDDAPLGVPPRASKYKHLQAWKFI